MQSDITSVAAVFVQLSTDRLSYVVIRGGEVFRGDLNLGEKCTLHSTYNYCRWGAFEFDINVSVAGSFQDFR